MTISQLCCAGLVLAFVGCLALLIIWAMCHVAALDRIIDAALDRRLDDDNEPS